MSCTRRRGVGPSRLFPSSFTSTKSTRVVTLPPGNSLNSSLTRYVQVLEHSVRRALRQGISQMLSARSPRPRAQGQRIMTLKIIEVRQHISDNTAAPAFQMHVEKSQPQV